MAHRSDDRLDRFPLRIYLSVAGMLVFTAGLLLFLTYLKGIPLVRMLRDPASYYDYSPFSGMISYGGILLMTAASAITGFAAAFGRRRRGVLAAVAVFSGYFALDDLFMLHEGVWPRIGIPEEVIVALIALAALAILLALRRQADGERLWGLYLALGLMVCSILVDMFLLSDAATVTEDLFKFTALGIWLMFWTGVAGGAVASQTVAAPERLMPVQGVPARMIPAQAKAARLGVAKWR